jgi:glycosyltransferase involved in cell wall biosynthesis
VAYLVLFLTKEGGPKEIIVDNKTGYIIPSNDINAWIEKIENIISWYYNKNTKMVEMRNDAVNYIHTKFNLTKIFPKLISDLNEN